jgi:hypothetical protein
MQKILLILICLFVSFEVKSKGINLLCKSEYGGDAGVVYDVFVDIQSNIGAINRFNGRPVNGRLNLSGSQVWFTVDKVFTLYIHREYLTFKLYKYVNAWGGFTNLVEKGICYEKKNRNKF